MSPKSDRIPRLLPNRNPPNRILRGYEINFIVIKKKLIQIVTYFSVKHARLDPRTPAAQTEAQEV